MGSRSDAEGSQILALLRLADAEALDGRAWRRTGEDPARLSDSGWKGGL